MSALLALALAAGCSSVGTSAPPVPAPPKGDPGQRQAAGARTGGASGGGAQQDPAAGASQAQLEILTDPPTASVFVNGRLAGATPLCLEGLAPGFYGLRLEKLGCAPKWLSVTMGTAPRRLSEKLEPLPVGVLVVDVEPRGAEVILDGELAGLVPLRLPAVAAGPHELAIRKTNFKSFTTALTIRPGETQRFADFRLEDRILEMLDGLIQAEPYRVAHYIDKGHYLFINNRMGEAAEAFFVARDTAEKPLDLPPEMLEEERLVETRLRADDRRRLTREIEKHRNPRLWPGKDLQEFVTKLDEGMRAREWAGSWSWVEASGRNLMMAGQFDRAEQVYMRHLERTPTGESVYPCMLELLKARLALRNLPGAGEVFTKLLGWARDNPDRLLELGQSVMRALPRLRLAERDEGLALAEKALRPAYEAARTKKELKADAAFELGNVLVARGHPAEAVAYYQLAVADTVAQELCEDRALSLAEGLRSAGRSDEARETYAKLLQSARANVRDRARAGLELLKLPRKENTRP